MTVEVAEFGGVRDAGQTLLRCVGERPADVVVIKFNADKTVSVSWSSGLDRVGVAGLLSIAQGQVDRHFACE